MEINNNIISNKLQDLKVFSLPVQANAITYPISLNALYKVLFAFGIINVFH